MEQNDLKSFLKSVITLFRLREGGFEWTGECGRWRVLAWSTKNLASVRVQSEGKLDEYRYNLRKEMTDGVIVAVDSGPMQEIIITAVDAYGGPRGLICVDVGGSIKGFDISERLTYAPGDLFIIPVDGPSSDLLHRLREDLQWLSPDQERSIFHLLGQSSLESRMETIEAEIRQMKDEGQCASVPGSGRTLIQFAKGQQAGSMTFFARYRIWICVGALLLLALGLLWFLWYKPQHPALMMVTTTRSKKRVEDPSLPYAFSGQQPMRTDHAMVRSQSGRFPPSYTVRAVPTL